MKGRRTKKQKLNSHHSFTFSWSSQPRVKGQFASNNNFTAKQARDEKNAMFLAQEATTDKIKKDILKSLIIVSLILASELMIYLAWYAK